MAVNYCIFGSNFFSRLRRAKFLILFGPLFTQIFRIWRHKNIAKIMHVTFCIYPWQFLGLGKNARDTTRDIFWKLVKMPVTLPWRYPWHFWKNLPVTFFFCPWHIFQKCPWHEKYARDNSQKVPMSRAKKCHVEKNKHCPDKESTVKISKRLVQWNVFENLKHGPISQLIHK